MDLLFGSQITAPGLFGALVNDKNGIPTDVIAGFSDLDSYLTSTDRYYGATIGRYCNRIKNGEFELKGKKIFLPKNDGNNCLHGGADGFHSKVWDVEQPDRQSIKFNYLSPHLEGGFPGNLHVCVTYSLTQDNSIRIQYKAQTDRATVINLANHAYFNLNGEGSGSILRHKLKVKARFYLPLSNLNVPMGIKMPTAISPFDRREHSWVRGQPYTE